MTPKAGSKKSPSPKDSPAKGAKPRPVARKRPTATESPPPVEPPESRAPPGSDSDLPTGYPLPGSSRPHPFVGVGLWALGRWARDDEARTAATIEHALARGVVWFDTAEVYGMGRSERLLGEALARSRERADAMFLASKVSWEHLRPTPLRAALTGTLQRLGLPRIDLYLIHAPDPRVPLTETMPVLEEMWREGKIGAIGVSNFSVAELEAAQAALHEARIGVNQVYYNLFNREDGEGVLEYCRAHGIVVEAYTPLARGLLAGKYLDGQRPPVEVRRFARDLFDADRFPELVARAKKLQELAKDAKVPMASLALHWLRRQGCAPVVGASVPDQVDLLLQAWSRTPSDALLDKADAIAQG